jgi:hypothetical protein
MTNHRKALEYADKGLEIIQEIRKNDNKTSLINESGLENFHNKFLQIKNIKNKQFFEPIVRKKISRNNKVRVKYIENGEVKEGKYKNFEKDIEKKKCIVLE